MILRIGEGRRRTSVGMATISSPAASCGFSTRSTISISYRESRCSSHSATRLANAAQRLRGLAGDVQAQLPLLRRSASGAVGGSRRSSPAPPERRLGRLVRARGRLVAAAQAPLLQSLLVALLAPGGAAAEQPVDGVGLVLELAPQDRPPAPRPTAVRGRGWRGAAGDPPGARSPRRAPWPPAPKRAEPVRTPWGPTYTSASSIPRSVSRNSRTWLECAMPRDLSTDSTRLCSPLPSSVRTQQPGVDQRRDDLVGRPRAGPRRPGW